MAWTYHSRDGAANVQCTPIIVGGTLFAPTPGRNLVALDATTGEEKWRFPLHSGPTVRLQDAPARRGLVYWPGDEQNPHRLLVGAGDWVYAMDLVSGKPLAEFGENGRTPLPTGATVSAAICGPVFVTSGLFGDVYGYDVRSGKNLWRFESIPKGARFGADTWKGPQQGANGWGGLSVDVDRGMAFVALGAPRPDMVGVHRLGDNLFSNCVVALDVRSGERLWHFQDVRHDIWDLDVCAPPNLVTLERDGRRVDAVTAVSKAGHLMLLDRVSGRPLFPWRMRRAPASRLPGEQTAPYQPDPELPEPISRMEFSPEMITERSPEAREFVLQTVRRSNYGFFAPMEEGKPTLYIGSRGGAEWSGAAVDPTTGRLYVTSNRWVSKITVLSSGETPRKKTEPPSAGEKIYLEFCAACHGPNRGGAGSAPPLYALQKRMTSQQLQELLRTGRGAMPPAPPLDPHQETALSEFLLRPRAPTPGTAEYTFDGFQFLVDHEGYPGIKPPWGLLNCYDLQTGKALWRVPLGELEALTREGMPITGSQNLGGATVTAGGLIFVAGTEDEKIRAFDAGTGRELWSAKLPFAGTAAPAVYEVRGRQYVVVTATGGGRVGGKSGAGDAYVAFRLPDSALPANQP
jgi:quinoprotein glucose dehydrogenase